MRTSWRHTRTGGSTSTSSPRTGTAGRPRRFHDRGPVNGASAGDESGKRASRPPVSGHAGGTGAARVLEAILRARIVPIIRTSSRDWAVEAAEALAASGLGIIEITFTVPEAPAVIRSLRTRFPDVLVGAGTVTNADVAAQAVDAGAQFLLSPALSPGMIDVARRHRVLAVPGAFSPTEVLQALERGAELIKIFPAETGGPRHIRAILAPLAEARLLPTGGVTPENVGDWFKAGAAAVGIGTALVGPVGLLLLQPGAGPRAREVLYVDRDSALASIDPYGVAWTLLDGAHVVHLTGITPALCPNESRLVERSIADARRRRVRVSFD